MGSGIPEKKIRKIKWLRTLRNAYTSIHTVADLKIIYIANGLRIRNDDFIKKEKKEKTVHPLRYTPTHPYKQQIEILSYA